MRFYIAEFTCNLIQQKKKVLSSSSPSSFFVEQCHTNVFNLIMMCVNVNPIKKWFFFGKRKKTSERAFIKLWIFFGTTWHRRKNNFPKKISTLNRECLPTGEKNEKKIQFCCCVCRCCVRCNIVVLLNRQRRRLFVHRHDDEDDDYGARTLPTLTMIIIYLTRQPDESHYSRPHNRRLSRLEWKTFDFFFTHEKSNFHRRQRQMRRKKSFSSSHFHTHNFHSIP